MRKKLIILLLVLALTVPVCSCGTAPGVSYTADGYALNTYVSVTLYGCGSRSIAEKAVGLCGYYERIFSRTLEDSLLYRLNEEGGLDIDSEEARTLAEAVQLALEYGELTEGALDITVEPLTALWDFGGANSVPEAGKLRAALALVDYSRVSVGKDRIELNGARLDMGAVAKGYIADRIREYLVGEGIDSALIYLGGNVLCIGDKPDGQDFTVGVQRPFGGQDDVICAVRASGMSVVTSGVYERFFYEGETLYHHILDPSVGFPSDSGLLSVTVIAEDSALCDALSTALFVMGRKRAEALLEGLDGVYVIFVDKDYNVFYSEGAMELVSGNTGK